MCGIAGIISFGGQSPQDEDLRTMMRSIKHRGPDDEGVFMHQKVGFGFVRLNIIDLSDAANQPFQSEDERFTLVFNGEIYNYIELREELMLLGYDFKTQSDTEVLLKSYIAWGEAAFHKFVGMWALAIYDREEDTVFFSRDRFGIKPFYYYVEDDFFYFASEIPAILSVKKQEKQANYDLLYDYLVFNKTEHTEDTFFKGIKKLRHGYCLKLNLRDNKNIQAEKWYDLAKEVDLAKGFVSSEEYKQELHQAVRLHLRSDVPLGVSFSGGLDSSALVSLIAEEQKTKDVHTFSAVFKEDFEGNESEYIALYEDFKQEQVYPDAENLLAQLDELIQCHTEPFTSTSIFAQFKVMEAASKKVTVMLDGQGADEQLAGYHYFFGFYFKDLFLRFRILRFFREIYSYLKIHKSLFAIKTFFFFFLSNRLRKRIKISEFGAFDKGFIKGHQVQSNISNDLYSSKSLKDSLINHFEFKLEHLLKWEDRNSMHFSIEARVPFLSHELVEKTLATDASLIISGGKTKYILREAVKGLVPEKIRMRMDKVGFVTPQDDWFRTPAWKTTIEELINSESFKSRGIFDADKVKNLYQKHLDSEISISREIWKWINTELWFRKFID